jgi:hypothetical protein
MTKIRWSSLHKERLNKRFITSCEEFLSTKLELSIKVVCVLSHSLRRYMQCAETSQIIKRRKEILGVERVFLFYETREVLIIWFIEVLCLLVSNEFLCLSVSNEVLCLSVSNEVLCLSVSNEILCLSASNEVLCLSVSNEVLCLSVSVLHVSACSPHFRTKQCRNCELYKQICSRIFPRCM